MRYADLAKVSAVDRMAGMELANTLTDAAGRCSDEEQAEALRSLAIAITDIAIEYRDRANELDRIIIDA